MSLSSKKCEPCEIGTPPLTEKEIEKYIPQLTTQWEVRDLKKIRKLFIFKNFIQAMGFVNKVALIAEAEGHHPEMYIHYNKVEIELWTHKINGLSENDFIIASKIENL